MYTKVVKIHVFRPVYYDRNGPPKWLIHHFVAHSILYRMVYWSTLHNIRRGRKSNRSTRRWSDFPRFFLLGDVYFHPIFWEKSHFSKSSHIPFDSAWDALHSWIDVISVSNRNLAKKPQILSFSMNCSLWSVWHTSHRSSPHLSRPNYIVSACHSTNGISNNLCLIDPQSMGCR
jgi:hypothetical protein